MLKTGKAILLSFLLMTCFGAAGQGVPEKIDITTLPGLQFDKVQFAVKPGARVELIFTNSDDMSHNLLIVRPGKRAAVVEASMALAEKGPEMGYIPKSKDVLWHIPVISPGEKKTLSFTAPSAAGAYPYVCTYPGHGFVMYGVMHVSPTLAMPAPDKDPDVPDSRKGSGDAHAAHHHGEPRLHPYELKPPYIYRAFMEESGLASIAVRLPHELAFCWDAETCKLRYAWAGGFLDTKDFWHGHKNAYPKILGEIFYRDSEAYPLRVGNRDLVPSVVFKGYRMVDRYPEFLYLVNGLEVQELIREKPDGSGFERRFRLPNGLEPVWFLYGENDGMKYDASAGEADTERSVRLSPAEAREFIITMTRLPQ